MIIKKYFFLIAFLSIVFQKNYTSEQSNYNLPEKIINQTLLDQCKEKNTENHDLYLINHDNKKYTAINLGPSYKSSLFPLENNQETEVIYCEKSHSFYELIAQQDELSQHSNNPKKAHTADKSKKTPWKVGINKYMKEPIFLICLQKNLGK